MDMRWHKVVLECPKCHVEPLIQSLSFSADGEVLVEMLCPKCQALLAWTSSLPKLVAKALYADIETYTKPRPVPKPVKVPLLLPPKETPADKQFFHDLGIIDPEAPNG